MVGNHNAILEKEINIRNDNIITTSHDFVLMKYGTLIESATRCIIAP